ncbi:MAG: chorismate-binding protein [Bifidobacteriaceae bacterium]|nr:chorismate-binding protein [Bifidobacteriaceae bacterium]
MTRILIIDNFDSFTNNLAQYVHAATALAPLVVPNTTAFADLPLDAVDGVLISPGPGRPSRLADFGVCRAVIERAGLPLLGVCLGHQGIAEAFGGTVAHAPAPAHGVVDSVRHCGEGLFAGLPQPLSVVRYHSLVVTQTPDQLEVTAVNEDGLIMAVRHREKPIWGVQFHPESIGTECGQAMIQNFVDAVAQHGEAQARESAVARAFARVGGALTGGCAVRPLPGRPDCYKLFADRFAASPNVFWLDSENSDHPDARFSIMGGSPADVRLAYSVEDRRLEVAGPDGTEFVDGDLFDVVGDLLRAMDYAVDGQAAVGADGAAAEGMGVLPLTGGLVGYLGYELKALCDGSAIHPARTADAMFLSPAIAVVVDHVADRAWEVTFGGRRPGSVAEPGQAAAPGRPAAGAVAERPGYAPGPVPEAALGLRDCHDVYVSKIIRAQSLIRDGESYEVCLTNNARLQAPEDALAVYGRMRAASPVPYGAFLRYGDVVVLSSSPESFVRIDGDGLISSSPIKGTRPRSDDPAADQQLAADLRASVKDRAENLMIVDLVRHDLNAVCRPGSVAVSSAFAVQSFRSVHQLVSTVTGSRAAGRDTMDVLRACFPPGSMTGAPKRRTMEIIHELEGEARGVYSGAIGWLDASGAAVLSVVIRTLVVAAGSADLGVGGAITALSDPEDEFEETLVKASIPYFGLGGAL